MSSGGTEQPNQGPPLPIDNLPMTIEYNGGLISALVVEYQGNTYRKTFSRTMGLLTGYSRWVKQ